MDPKKENKEKKEQEYKYKSQKQIEQLRTYGYQTEGKDHNTSSTKKEGK